MNEDIEFPAPISVATVSDKVQAAYCVWFFTPEYNQYFPGVLKNLIDWLSRPIGDEASQVLEGKSAAISEVIPGMTGTSVAQDHLVTLLSLLNMDIINKPRLTIPTVYQQLDELGELSLQSSKWYLEKQVKGFISFLEECK